MFFPAALLTMILAGFLVSLTNACMRKSVDVGGHARSFVIVQLSLSCLVAFLMGPVQAGHYEIAAPSLFLGLLAGFLLGAMMLSLGRSLEFGPSGLSFAAVNASSCAPGIIMTLIFGAALGFPYNLTNAIGTLMVLSGLFWAGNSHSKAKDYKHWLFYVLSAFSLHTALMCLMQWRALMLRPDIQVQGYKIPFALQEASAQWFTPLMFFVAVLFQFFTYLKHSKHWPDRKEIFYGALGGISNGLAMYLMVKATRLATPLESVMLFPFFSVTIIAVANCFGQLVYKEKVNWPATGLAITGLLIGTIDWNLLF